MDDLALAHHLATVATAAAAPYLHERPAATTKSDGSPVTEADLAIETALLAELAHHRRDDDVLAEESGLISASTASSQAAHGATVVPGERCWVLDPLDGTEAFLAGKRSWGTHVALQVDGTTVLGVITRPTEGRRWWAVRGRGAWTASDVEVSDLTDQALALTGRRLRVSSGAELVRARVGGFATETSALARAVSRHARWTSDPLSPVLGLAEGRLEAVVATGGQVWDHAPQVLLVMEAGGAFTDPQRLQRPDAGGGVYSNGRLDVSVLAAAAWPT